MTPAFAPPFPLFWKRFAAKTAQPAGAWFKSRLHLRGGWGRRPEGDAPRSEASALGARWLSPARPQPHSSCHLQDAEIEPCPRRRGSSRPIRLALDQDTSRAAGRTISGHSPPPSLADSVKPRSTPARSQPRARPELRPSWHRQDLCKAFKAGKWCLFVSFLLLGQTRHNLGRTWRNRATRRSVGLPLEA